MILKIQRRDFLKMLGAFSGAMVAEGLAPQGIIKPADIEFPKGSMVAQAAPGITPNRTEAGIIRIVGLNIGYPRDVHQVRTIDGGTHYLTVPDWVTADLEIVTDNAGAKKLMDWYYAGEVLPFWHNEWLCVFCGSAQPMPRTHCSQCGGARDWVVT